MPTPNSGEKRSDFISRCIPIVIHEGTTKDPKQAAAICHSIWRKKHPGAKAELDYDYLEQELCNIKGILEKLKSSM